MTLREDRLDGYGGLVTLARKNILLSRIKINELAMPNNFQYIAMKVHNLTIVNVYCPPNTVICPTFWKKFIRSFFTPLIVIGDLNAHHSIWDTSPINRSGRTIASLLDELNLVVLNDGSRTRFVAPNNLYTSAVDLTICSSNIGLNADWRVIGDPGTSDHFPTLCNFPDRDEYLPPPTVCPKRHYRRANWAKYRLILDSELETNSPIVQYEKLSEVVNVAALESIPTQSGGGKQKNIPVPWWDEECKVAISNKKRALKDFQVSCSLDNYMKAKQAIASAHRLFRKKKKRKI